MDIVSTILFGLAKILTGILVLAGALLNPQVAPHSTTTPPAADLWHVTGSSDLNLGEIVSTLNIVGSVAKKAVSIPSNIPALNPTFADVPTVQKEPLPAPAEKPRRSGGGIPASTTAPTPQPVPAPTPQPASMPLQSDLSALNERAHDAVVNVLCTTGGGGPVLTISGSGVFIDPRGVILTNAHVAQFFLLRDYPTQNNVQCVIRTGSPARATYTAALLYISQQWIAANARQIISSAPSGTGENDYAFLLVTGRTDSASSLPASFSYVEPSTARVSPNESMLLVAYPASLLDGSSIQTNLYASTAFSYVQQVFAFHEGEAGVDLFSVGGSAVAQGGSSGGAAVRQNTGTLAGIFVTALEASTTGPSDLRALALSHIDESLRAEGEGGIVGELSGNLLAKADSFTATVFPLLAQKLKDVLNGPR